MPVYLIGFKMKLKLGTFKFRFWINETFMFPHSNLPNKTKWSALAPRPPEIRLSLALSNLDGGGDQWQNGVRPLKNISNFSSN